ncbi:hypothetical protein JMJ35_009089 [Cladonia borealis]|uniref:Uncharacterized protein n=1 Tax=Cladonia borealis TaxID=184061 RepID=A0AA39UYH7_9LECA|nr:hypothetical protein JMJ35_009089 [Cladonia borealis]
MASQDPYPTPPQSPAKAKGDPILRNTLRYTISAKEYKTLHEWFISRSPQAVRRRAPTPHKYASLVQTKDDYNGAAIRASLRVFIATQTSLQLWELIKTNLLAKRRPSRTKARNSVLTSPNLRLSLSLSLILLLHRVLFRFFSRLRTNLLTKDAAPFRRRNPRISRSLTSRLAPAIGASLAGFALGVYPGDQLRITIAIYVATRSLEFAYSALEEDGWFKNKPWWWGSWMLMPLACGQLLHAFVFDRDCFPKAYGDFILENTPNYVQCRPATYPPSLPWPSTTTIIDSLAEMSRLNWPPFISPILFPNAPHPLPALSPITSSAHPSHTSLSCATLHPATPSCTTTFLSTLLSSFPTITKVLAAYYTLFSLPKYRKFLSSPTSEINLLAKRILQTAAFLTGAIGSSWGSICLFQYLFPRTFLPSARWFLGGFLGGMWGVVDRKGGKGHFLYSMRLSIDSLWKVGVKRGYWKGVSGGDVAVFVAGLAVVNVVYEKRRGVIGDGLGKGVGWLRGEEFFGNKKEGEEKEKEK